MPLELNHAVRRLFLDRALPLGLLLCLGSPLLSDDSSVITPRAEPFDYPANVANGDVALGARVVPQKEVRKVFRDRLFPNDRLQRLSQNFTVVEVGFYPSDKKAVAINLQAFHLMSGQRPVAAVTPQDAVFELIHGRPRDSPIQLAGKARKNEHSNLYENAMSGALFLRALPVEARSGPRAGYLYFSAKPKDWKGAESLIVEYVWDGKPIKLVLPVSR